MNNVLTFDGGKTWFAKCHNCQCVYGPQFENEWVARLYHAHQPTCYECGPQ